MLVLVGVFAWATPSSACSGPAASEVRFFLFDAPTGGLWWVHGIDERLNAESLQLADEAGNETEVAVVSLGAGGSAGLRVPNAPAGTRFVLPDFLERPQGAPFEQFLVVATGAVAASTDPPPAPAIAIEMREVRVGYAGVVVSPIGGECEAAGAPGFWDIHYDERPFLIAEPPGDDVVLDVEFQTVDKPAFSDAESANEILFDARIAEEIDTMISAPPGAVDAFNVHARVRRITDGAFSDVVTIEVPIDDVPEVVRLEYVGCSGASAPSGPTTMALVCVAFAAGRRRASRRMQSLRRFSTTRAETIQIGVSAICSLFKPDHQPPTCGGMASSATPSLN